VYGQGVSANDKEGPAKTTVEEDNGEEEGKRRRGKGERGKGSEIKVEEEEEEGIEGTGDLVAIPGSGNPADCFGRRYQERAKSFLWGGQPAERQHIFCFVSCEFQFHLN